MSGNEWEQGRAYVRRLREELHTDDEIRQTMLEGGWEEEQIEELLAPKRPPAGPATAAPASRRRAARPAGAADISGGAKAGIILVSILAPLAGFIWGVIYVFSGQAAKTRWGAWGLVVSVLFGLGHIAVFFPIVATMGPGRQQARQVSCLSNMKQLAIGELAYCQDYDERMPDAANWQEQTYPYVQNEQVYHCPSGGTYAMNDKLSGKTFQQIFGMGNPARIILFYEVDNSGNPLYDVHNGGANYAYVAGNASWREKPE